MKSVVIYLTALISLNSFGFGKNFLCKKYIKNYIKSGFSSEFGEEVKRIRLKYITSQHSAPSGDIYEGKIKTTNGELYKLSFIVHNWIEHASQRTDKISIFKPATFCEISQVHIEASSIKDEVFEAIAHSKQKDIPVGIILRGQAIRNAKKKIKKECLEKYTSLECKEVKFEVEEVKKISHRQCGGTLLGGPEGKCAYFEAKVIGQIK